MENLIEKALTNKLSEMAMEYDPNFPERTGRKTQSDIEKQKTTYKDHPAFPKNSKTQHFAEIVASEQFKKILQNIRKYSKQPVHNASQLMMSIYFINENVMQIEQSHREELLELTKKIVMQLFNIKENEIIFDIKFAEIGNVKKDLKRKYNNADEVIEATEELATLDIEVAKRRFINGLIQGSSIKGQYSFHLVDNELRKISPELPEMYGLLMSVAQFAYWQDIAEMFGDEESENMQAGSVEVDFDKNKKPIVRSRGLNFPMLLQETIKGVMELMSMHGLPKEKNLRKSVISKADFLKGERWDILLGPGLWEKFLDAVDVSDNEIVPYLYSRIVQMPAEEFNSFMKELMAGSSEGKAKLKQLASQIKSDISKWDAEDAIKKAKNYVKDNDIDDIDISKLTDLLKEANEKLKKHN